MIEIWSRDDVELLTGSHVFWQGSFDWRAVDCERTETEWRIVLENKDGTRASIGLEDVASGRARIRAYHRPYLAFTAEGRPAPQERPLTSIKKMLRRSRLASPDSYVS